MSGEAEWMEKLIYGYRVPFAFRANDHYGAEGRAAWALAGFNADLSLPSCAALEGCKPNDDEHPSQLSGHWGFTWTNVDILFNVSPP